MDKRFWGAIAVIALIFVGIVVVNNRNSEDKAGDAQPTSHIRGAEADKADVTLVEYGDFQCPVCYSYYPVVEAVTTKYEADVRFQFRNFPLQSAHKNAFAASRAVEAAGNQGKFWEMYAQLYQNQDPNGQQGWVMSSDPLKDYFTTLAKSAGVADISKFETDFASEATSKIINADINAGNGLKVNGTPSFFLDGKKIELAQLVGDNGRPDEAKFSNIIDKAIKAKGGKTDVDPNVPATAKAEDTTATDASQAGTDTSGQ